MPRPESLQESGASSVTSHAIDNGYISINPMRKRVGELDDRLTRIESLLANGGSTTPGAVSHPESRAGSRTSRIVGITAVAVLVVFLDSRIAEALSVDKSSQLAWATWLLGSVPFALWLAFSRWSTWPVALGVGLIRALEKALVMANWWCQNDRAIEAKKICGLTPCSTKQIALIAQTITFRSHVESANVWEAVFAPEWAVFLAAFWLGLSLLDITHTRRVGESEPAFERRVRRLTAVMTAIAPILTLLGALLVPVVSGLVTQKDGSAIHSATDKGAAH